LPTLRFDGPTLEEAVEAAKRQLGPAPKIVAATRVRKGGVGGFFAREHVEVEVEVDGKGRSPRAAARAPREDQPSRPPASSGPAQSDRVNGSAKAAPAAQGGPRPRAADPRASEPRRAEPRWTDEHSALIDNGDPMSALIEEMADNPPSSVLDLAEKINAEQGHFALAGDNGSQGGRGQGGRGQGGRGQSGSSRAPAGRGGTGGEAPAQGTSGRAASGRESAARENAARQGAERKFLNDSLAEREPVSPVATPDVARSGERHADRREEKRGRRWRQNQPDDHVVERAVEPDRDEPAAAENAPSTGFAAVLERIAKEAGLATPGSEAGGAAFRAPAPASHADLILTELSDPRGLADRPGLAEPRQATATVDLAEPRVPAAPRLPAAPRVPLAPREWTEPLWLPAAGEPRWLAAPAVLARLSQPETQVPERRLPERAPRSGSLVPANQGPHLSELGLALQSLGVPVQACTAVTPTATRETIEGELRRALDLALPALPPAPKSPKSVVAVVGPPNTVMSTAQGIARDLGASPDEVALATQRKVWRPQDRVILSAEVAIEERRSWRWRDHPSVVAIEQDVRPERSAWTTEILQALEPTLCWGVAKASHKPEDLEAWSESLGGLDMLALVELDSTTTPAAALAAPIPVGRLDGEPATPALWATLLCARLME
jgi:hypothetical protein